jgi:type I restriction enzyme M protein
MVDRVLFINAENLYRRGRNQNALENKDVLEIHKLYTDFKSVEGMSYLASAAEIRHQKFSLNIPLYVAQIQDLNQLSFKEHLVNLNEAGRKLVTSRDSLLAELKKWGLDVEK